MKQPFTIKITKNFENLNISQFLEKLFVGKAKKYKIVSGKCFQINRYNSDPDYYFQENDELTIDLSPFEVQEYQKIDFPLEILYEDPFILIINKPAGNIVYDMNDKSPSICNYVSAYFANCHNKCDIIPIHRLDTDTTGCLMIAKDILTAAYMANCFEKNQIAKKYVALVEGKPDLEGIIKYNIGSDRHQNGKMVTCRNGKPAITKYQKLREEEYKALLELTPLTGRTHQIRVHLAAIGHPIVGDKMYGSRISNSRICLHCSSLTFYHPFKNRNITITSGIPKEFQLKN